MAVILFLHLSAGAVGNITVITAMAIMFALLIMKPVYALLNLGIHYLIFVLFLYSTFSSGEVINFTITTLLCGLIYFVRYHHLRIELSQARLIDDIQNELTEMRKNFRLSLEQYELILEKENYMTFEWNIEKDRIYFSKEWRDWFDESEDIPKFSSYIQERKTLAQDQKELILKCLEDVRKGVIFQKHELFLPLKTGKKGWFDLRVITQMNDRNEPISGIGTLLDITLQKERISKLEQETRMDLFTGLLNKTAIERYGHRKLKELRQGEILAALILDMDDFKGINDNFGHPAGDHVLKEVAGIILKKAPAGARVGRMGGDEFMVLLTTEDLRLLERYAVDLIWEVSQIKWGDADVGASCCIGISAADSDKWTYSRLYQGADNALYQAKRRGRGQICCHEPGQKL